MLFSNTNLLYQPFGQSMMQHVYQTTVQQPTCFYDQSQQYGNMYRQNSSYKQQQFPNPYQPQGQQIVVQFQS